MNTLKDIYDDTVFAAKAAGSEPCANDYDRALMNAAMTTLNEAAVTIEAGIITGGDNLTTALQTAIFFGIERDCALRRATIMQQQLDEISLHHGLDMPAVMEQVERLDVLPEQITDILHQAAVGSPAGA